MLGPSEQDINIFTQIGLVVLVGPGEQERDPDRRVRQADPPTQGKPIREATLEACRLRLRPIVMTSLAFILGVLPLLLAHGAGAEMRQSLGMAVFSGMLGVTFFGIFLTPVFFYVIDTLSESPLFSLARGCGGSARDRSDDPDAQRILWRPSRWQLAQAGVRRPGPAGRRPRIRAEVPSSSNEK